VSSNDKGWFASQYGRLSTGLKMLLILTLGLFPLGLIAILASVQSAEEKSQERRDRVHARAELKTQRINSALSRSAFTIRAASAAISLAEPTPEVCRIALSRLARAQASPGKYALFLPGNRLGCATAGYRPVILPRGRGSAAVEISEDGEALRFALYDSRGRLEGTGEFSRESLAQLAQLPGTDQYYNLELRQGDRRMRLRQGYRSGPLVRPITATQPVANGRLTLHMSLGAAPITAAELLTILLPVMMWIGAGAIGWLIVNRLLLRPLVRMQEVVSAYKPGDRALDLPTIATPAREIGALGQAFDRVTRTVAQHEADLEAAVTRQTRLVREVHHRVKNNLQVVASLLNLHSRGSKNEDVAAAYASIQRRVDALAVVHRNHYAELEENRGVALKPLISELAANLRATAPAAAGNTMIRLDIEPYYVTQDVAVSVAFLITELVEFLMFASSESVAISLDGEDGTALLAVESEGLKAGVAHDELLFERFDRIITGLSRQLRSSMNRDLEAGRYSLTIAVVERAER
jgi:two-component system, sensor histidine kinase PdtaS